MKKGNIQPSSFAGLIKEIRRLITAARNAVISNINIAQVITNFEIGRRIVEHEQQGNNRAEYGKALLKDLSSRLTEEFGRGFSRSNLEYMRKFYMIYRNRLPEKCQMASGISKEIQTSGISQMASGKSIKQAFSLSWSQYVFLTGVKDEDTRSFYEIEAADNNWTLPELIRQFNSGLYERLALSRDKKGVKKLAKEGQVISKQEDLLKEPYVLEFLGLDEKAKYSESDLGQMQMYVNYFDRHVKTEKESSTIGIVLCQKNREALVKITLPKNANIHAKEYRLYLPSKEELKQKLLVWTKEIDKNSS
ncbi:DUF1016 family protein [bacterium]|nr:DUF1016 family protein [bacterium]